MNNTKMFKIKKEPEEILKEIWFGLLTVKNVKRKMVPHFNEEHISIEGSRIIKLKNCSVNKIISYL